MYVCICMDHEEVPWFLNRSVGCRVYIRVRGRGGRHRFNGQPHRPGRRRSCPRPRAHHTYILAITELNTYIHTYIHRLIHTHKHTLVNTYIHTYVVHCLPHYSTRLPSIEGLRCACQPSPRRTDGTPTTYIHTYIHTLKHFTY